MKLSATSVSKTFGRRLGETTRPAVDEVTVEVSPGDFTAIVGESGSGKSTLARMMLGLITPDHGEVAFDGVPLAQMDRRARMRFRSAVQCVLQDPSAALNPRRSVREILAEVIELHDIAKGRAGVEAKVCEALELVDLVPAQRYADRFPHQLSGGQRQRVLIARAVILRPSVIVADEAVSALDVSVKAGVLNLLNRLRGELGVGYLFITHDLPVVHKVAEYVYVMRGGQVVEHAPAKTLFESPQTDYTRELLAAAPKPDPAAAREWLRTSPA